MTQRFYKREMDIIRVLPPCEVIFRKGKTENDSFKEYIPDDKHNLFVPDRFPNIHKVYVKVHAFTCVINKAAEAQSVDSAQKEQLISQILKVPRQPSSKHFQSERYTKREPS